MLCLSSVLHQLRPGRGRGGTTCCLQASWWCVGCALPNIALACKLSARRGLQNAHARSSLAGPPPVHGGRLEHAWPDSSIMNDGHDGG